MASCLTAKMAATVLRSLSRLGGRPSNNVLLNKSLLSPGCLLLQNRYGEKDTPGYMSFVPLLLCTDCKANANIMLTRFLCKTKTPVKSTLTLNDKYAFKRGAITAKHTYTDALKLSYRNVLLIISDKLHFPSKCFFLASSVIMQLSPQC